MIRASMTARSLTTGLRAVGVGAIVALSGCADSTPAPALSKAELGEALFHDANLSAHRTQACATCHDPEAGFVDARTESDSGLRGASLGDDGVSLGDRNTPTAAYARFIPPLSNTTRQRARADADTAVYEGYLGGLFYDGRAADLAEQAGGPPLNPGEMGMTDEPSVVERLLENDEYVASFRAHYGKQVFDDHGAAYAAMTDALATFERSELFAPFDSRYDRSLLPVSDERRYEYDPASKAAAGKALFFSSQFTSCATCHLRHTLGSAEANVEPFSAYEYHNLGVPENVELRERNGAGIDRGLGGILDDAAEDGKFRTPTLRNVAVTAPYMHNGVFRELSTVIRFYEHIKRGARGDADDALDPETGATWREPETSANFSELELSQGSKDLTDDANVLAIECFLLSLTDARYEPLLDPGKVELCGL